jgi:hypothetical protein
MILDAADFEHFHFDVAGNSAEIGPKLFLKVRIDERATFLRGKHDV